jgi:zinc protease
MNRFRLNATRLLLLLLLGTGCPGSEGMMAVPGPVPEPEPPVTPLVFPDEPFRATRPAPAAAAAFALPRPETFMLPSGMQVFLVERRTVPNVSWFVSFPGGSLQDPPGKTGLASLCLNVSFQGSNTLTRQDREQLLADMSSFVDLGAGSDAVSWSGEALQPHLGATADIWMDLFLAPALGQAAFDGTQRARVSTLAAGPSQTPGAVSSRVSNRLYWGREHPFNRVITAASLMQVTLPDCQDFFRRVVQPKGAKLYVSGAINRAELMATFQRLSSWTGTGTASMTLPAPPATPVPGRVFFVNAAGAPQSIITIRGKGPARTAPDYLAAEMMASILAGDSISSRIGLNVREMHGYTYSLGGGFGYTTAGGIFTFTAPVRADVTGESVFEVLEEIRKLREAGVTTEELDRERRYRLAGLPYSFETARSTSAQYQFLDTFGIPFDHFDNYARSVQAVTAAAIQQAATSYLGLDGLQVVVVGDAGQALPKLRTVVAMRPDVMGAQVTVLDSEANPTAGP